MDDVTLSLAFSIYSNPGVFALLLGSGVSRSAGVPTGWEIVLDLCRKLAHMTDEDPGASPDEWYRRKFGKEARYDELLEALAHSPQERSSLLNSYFIPTPEEYNQGRKVPTPAHRAIADMVRNGYIRMILTTNFDRIMESALKDACVDYDVVSTDDSLSGVTPYVHSKCLVVKLHGDFKDNRFKNTPEELAQYSSKLNRLLDRILDEFGLIVAGWSGTWDEALRSAILRFPSSRYSWYWLKRGELTEQAEGIIQHRSSKAIPISSAEDFFPHLAELVNSLRSVSAHNPLSAKVAAATTKRLLSDERFFIELDDLFTEQAMAIRRAVGTFIMNPSDANSAYVQQLDAYVEKASIIAAMSGVVGYYGATEAHRSLLTKVVKRLGTLGHADGYEAFLNLRRMPALIAIYATGIASVAAKRFDNVRAVLLDSRIPDPYHGGSNPALMVTFPQVVLERRALPGGNNRAPESEFMHRTLRPSLEHLLPTDDEYDSAFDTFEYLACLVYLSLTEDDWGPVGRFGWSRQAAPVIRVFREEGEAQGESWPVVKCLFGGNVDKLQVALEKYKALRSKLPLF